MSKLLYIQASPRAERSHSRAVGDAFVTAYREANPEDSVVIVDLFKVDLPAFDGEAVNAKYAILHGQENGEKETAAWRAVERVINAFKSADKYVMAVPMWNFGIPYRLKQYLDLILQPGYTFSFDPEKGYEGLVKDKPILTIYARGGEYPEGSEGAAMDFQKKYLDMALGFMGFTDMTSIVVEPTLAGGPDTASERREAAISKAQELAKTF